MKATLPSLLALAALGVSSTAGAADAPVEKVTVRAVAHFGFDQTTIAPADQARILADVAKLSDVTWKTVTATGHTDSVGPSGYNARLSARRAAAVKGYLVGKGLDPKMISTAARAAEAPAAPNETPAGRALNRRTEIQFEGVRAAR
jgi:OOP family OmpA-OmpF porin